MSVELSVIMTVHNGERYLREAVASILEQTYRDFELVVVDNGSRDGSLRVLRGFDDPRLRIIELDRDIGRPEALNLALDAAQGTLIADLDADDVALPPRLEKQMSWMARHPNVALLGTWCEFIDEMEDHVSSFHPPITRQEILDTFATRNPFAHSTVIYRRDHAVKLGGYPVGLVQAHDKALWFGLSTRYEVANLPEELVRIRLHSGQFSGRADMRETKLQDSLTIYRQAEAHAGLSPEARKLARRTVVQTMLRHATLLIRGRRRLEGVRMMSAAIVSYRGLAVRDVGVVWWIARMPLARVRRAAYDAWKALTGVFAKQRSTI
jgi:hypothetical protein